MSADGNRSLTAIDDLLARNRSKAMSHPYWMGPVPTMAVAMVLCMDARVDAHAAFGIQPGETHLIRNAGGVVTDDVIRSLAISQHALGTREVMVVHHTDCGLARLEEDTFRERLATYAGYRPTWAVQAFKDPHDSVRESLRRIRDSPFLIHTHSIRGFIFDVESGLLEEVFADAGPSGDRPPAPARPALSGPSTDRQPALSGPSADRQPTPAQPLGGPSEPPGSTQPARERTGPAAPEAPTGGTRPIAR